ncbi:Hypothetical protein FKW44_011652 [Caligus rogercresseyi]|uniref:Uncharacterized protein n=1 Tax=Caligus rogercresseyi TaxID=217165 RepID=A0A7T8K8Z2_CALRO|nr:Hypothetical protein FKW44_011652 [Caligus rogercresseyi]
MQHLLVSHPPTQISDSFKPPFPSRESGERTTGDSWSPLRGVAPTSIPIRSHQVCIHYTQ